MKLVYSLIVLIPLLLLIAIPTTYSSNLNNKPAGLGVNLAISSKLLNKLSGNDGYYSSEAFLIKPPNVTPVTVHVVTNALFNNSGMVPYTAVVNIPQGNYSLILMNVSISEQNGAQYDRAFYIFANGTPIFWGSTQEILNSTSEADLTIFENLLSGPVEFQIVLPNYIAPSIGITGYYLVNVTLYLYPGNKPNGLPNYFIPLFKNGYNYSYAFLNPSHDLATQSFTLPNGTYKSELLLYEEGGQDDEFWYSNEPAIRNILVYYGNYLAGVLNPFETIYTGGIDLFYWKPLTSINTLSFHMPYYIDLTPFLAKGLNGSISVTVSNLLIAEQIMQVPYFTWDISGVLMLWVNSSNPLISGNMFTSKNNYLDSMPIMIQGYSGLYYQEVSSYYLNYTSFLKYEHGNEISSVVQKGVEVAKQTLSPYFQFAYLNEAFSESAQESGFYNSTLNINGNYPITMYYDTILTPITNPYVIPYNTSYIQNGSINLNPSYKISYTYNNYNFTEELNYNLNAVGGFSGIVEFINAYGGAVLVAITSNNALVTKTLNALYLVNGNGFAESYNAIGLQNSTVNLAGYLIKQSYSYSKISDVAQIQLHEIKNLKVNYHKSFSMVYFLKNKLFIY